MTDNNENNSGTNPPPPTTTLHLNPNRNITIHPIMSDDHQYTTITVSNSNPNSASEGRSNSDTTGGSITNTTTPASASTSTSTTSTSTSTMTHHTIIPSLSASQPYSMLSQEQLPSPRVVVLRNEHVAHIHHNVVPTMDHCRVPDRITLTGTLQSSTRLLRDDIDSTNPLFQNEFASYFGYTEQRRCCRSLPEILDAAMEISEEMMADLPTRMINNSNYEVVTTNSRVGLLPLQHQQQEPPAPKQ